MKKNNTEDLFTMFNLPTYVKGKSFADASKTIQKRFEGRTDKESMDTQKDLLGRLRQAQDYVKSMQEQAAPQATQAPQMAQGAPQGQYALGGSMGPGDKDKIDPNNPPTTGNPEFSDEQHARQNAATGIEFISKEENALFKPYVEDKAPELNMGRFKDMDYFKSNYNGGRYNLSPTSNNPANADVYKDNLRYLQSINPDVRINNDGHKNGFLPMGQRGTNDHFLGGILDAAKGAGSGGVGTPGFNPTEGANIASKGPGAMGVLGAATGALDMAQSAFGKSGVDTSGMSGDPGDFQKKGAAAGMGALKGAQAGMAFGPLGAGIGALAGGVSSFMGAKKMNKDIAEAKKNSTFAQINQMDNQYAKGGIMDSDPTPNDFNWINSLTSQIPSNPFENVTDWASNMGGQKDSITPRNNSGRLPEQQVDAQQIGFKGMNPSTPDITKGIAGTQSRVANRGNGDGALNKADLSGAAGLLRYAPAAMNAGQLLGLKKPEFEGLDRLGNRYERQMTDEEALQNLVREGTSNNRDAIVGASGGSAAAARANLIGSQLQSTKALSDAYMRGDEANKQENRAAQQFNLGVDQVNLQQSNQENDINARNKGNYDTQKSKLLAQLGDDLGGIGTEELFKKYPEMMGMYYDSKGKLLKNKKK